MYTHYSTNKKNIKTKIRCHEGDQVHMCANERLIIRVTCVTYMENGEPREEEESYVCSRHAHTNSLN